MARARFGALFERMVSALERGDPIADAAVQALEPVPVREWVPRLEHAMRHGDGPTPVLDLVAAARRVPDWVDWRSVGRAHRVLHRSGVLGGLVLGFRSLVYGYAAPAGNKPLIFSGRLIEDTPRRLAETGRFVGAVGSERGMRPGGEGFEITLKVRLMHARVRALASRDPRWRIDRWAVPINQHDMLATLLLFSTVYLQGLERLGLRFTPAEWSDYLHLWRWVGCVIGVEAMLLPISVDEALEMGEFIRATQGPPDDDARALVGALLTPPASLTGVYADPSRRATRRQLAESVCRGLIDPQTADGLELARHPAADVVDVVRTLLTPFERLRQRVPGVDRMATLQGARHWQPRVDARFTPPTNLRPR